MGAFCCVAARPHGSHVGSGEWSIGPNEPHYQTHGSFSPPLSRMWDYRFHSEAVSSGSHRQQHDGSSSSSTSRGRSRISSAHFSSHHYSASDGNVSNLSSPADSFRARQGNTSTSGTSIEEFVSTIMSESRSESLSCPLTKEGRLVEEQSIVHCDVESSSSFSDAGDSEQSYARHIPSSHCNYSGRYPFMSKPVYPITYAGQAIDGDADTNMMCDNSSLTSSEGRNSSLWPNNNTHHADKKALFGFSEIGPMKDFADHGSSSRRRQFRWNVANGLNFEFQHETPDQAGKTDGGSPRIPIPLDENLRCAICERWLFQKSPWSSHSMVRSGDMPVAGVLSCSHVYHAECLEQTTPTSQKHDPPCPLCARGFMRPSVSTSNESCSVNGLQLLSSPGSEFPLFNVTADDSSSSGHQNYFQSEYIAYGAGRKQSNQMPLENTKSFLRKAQLRKHFLFKGKSVKNVSEVHVDHYSLGILRRGRNLRDDKDTPFVKYHL